MLSSLGQQGRRKDLKLGGSTKLREHFFLKKNGAFSKNKKGTYLFIAKSWGHVPPGSYVSVGQSFEIVCHQKIKSIAQIRA